MKIILFIYIIIRMPSKSDCRRFNDKHKDTIPIVGLAKKYFKSGCSDPVTALSYLEEDSQIQRLF